MRGSKATASARALFSSQDCGEVCGETGQFGAEVLAGHCHCGEGISTLLSPIPCSFLQQLSPAQVPPELLKPLTYITLVGCSVSIVASLLTVLLHFQARYSPAPMPGLPTRRCSAPLLLIELIPRGGVGFSRERRLGGRRPALPRGCRLVLASLNLRRVSTSPGVGTAWVTSPGHGRACFHPQEAG